MTKKSKITAVPKAYFLKALSIKQPPKYCVFKEHADGTAVIKKNCN